MKWIKKGTFSGKQYRDDVSRKISWGHWFAFFNIIVAFLEQRSYRLQSHLIEHQNI